ncbi:MAG TPA: imidazoleglycerol-phosphate dehydratase HisB [Solirubrobacterales bacterium]|nr:imidazoleglycerol-phosphate dehydratase HisB [Solirubrobacterales bacterium]HNA44595.1 imidazoleglycerol-phosphate dehydratase HisB [Solirubrobacterales bacterium]HNC06777.1 imidazoleglycerol-phosphate dehydratase HisB [Solirubrobacterales bacterium]HNE78002.1 imidazoleglycerol-phosphate dehydratase HisB [Solirubrobacterales bacterium]HNI40343.1 imidazoleglycerol-phosphate dehydratase HisB [Solirubrobacterales bacterium]
MSRQAKIERKTKETGIELSLDLDGSGYRNETGVGFFDHMLDLLARHANLGLEVKATGDLETGSHHTVEDVGIVLGQAIDQALGDRAGIRRYGSAVVPMDEACAECALDISGRALSVFRGEIPVTSIANYETELTEEFFRAVAGGAKMTLHIDIRYGSNVHHMIEAAFKAFARALRVAVSIDPDEKGVPSTKGTLNG